MHNSPVTVSGQNKPVRVNNEHLFQPTYKYLSIMLIGSPAYMLMWALSTMVGVDGADSILANEIAYDNRIHDITQTAGKGDKDCRPQETPELAVECFSFCLIHILTYTYCYCISFTQRNRIHQSW